MSLSTLMDQIKQVKPYVEENTDIGPRETMAGRRGRKAQAIEQMKILKRNYRMELLNTAAFVIVTGSEQKRFTDLVTYEKFESFNANPDDFYQDLAGRIPEVLYKGKESVVNLFDIIGRHLYDKAIELDLNEYDQLIFKQEHYVSIKNKNDLIALLKKAINQQVGAEIVGIQAVTSLVDKAVSMGHNSRVTPIILNTDDETLALELESNLRKLHPRSVSLVVAGRGNKNLKAVPNVILTKEVTEETVEQTLKQAIKGKREK